MGITLDDWNCFVPSESAISAAFYITIVNPTPHTFVKTYSHQLNHFEVDDTPSGRARQNTITYGGGTLLFVDDISTTQAAWGRYQVQNADPTPEHP